MSVITAPMGGTNHLILQNQAQQPNQPSRHEHLYLDQFERVKTKEAKVEQVCILREPCTTVTVWCPHPTKHMAK
jgi:hypothetical protein